MDILIEFGDQILISQEESKKELNNYSSISLTAGNFTSNPNNFNFLPSELLENKDSIKEYEIFLTKVNEDRRVGVINQFPPTTYFFVPKTDGKENINDILIDLFAAVNSTQVEELLMTHWMYISSIPPENEFDSLVGFFKKKRKEINLKKIYFLIDKKYQHVFLDKLNILQRD